MPSKSQISQIRATSFKPIPHITIPDNLELPILEITQHPTTLDLPLFGFKIPAGFPSPADDHLEATIDLNQLYVPHPASTFFVRVKGHSMNGAGIFDGDMLIVDRSLEPESDSIVVAVINGEITVKRLDRSNNEIWLRAENPDYQDMQIKEGMEFFIWGVATDSFHSLK